MNDDGKTDDPTTDATPADAVADPLRTTPDMLRALLMGAAPTDDHLRAEIEQRRKLGAKW